MENTEDNKIQEAVTSLEINTGEAQKETVDNSTADPDDFKKENIARKSKSEFRSRLILTFVLGFLIGIALKTEALKKITIGYNDYLMKIKTQSYDINGIQTKLQKEREESAKAQEQEDAVNLENGQNGQGEISDQIEN